MVATPRYAAPTNSMQSCLENYWRGQNTSEINLYKRFYNSINAYLHMHDKKYIENNSSGVNFSLLLRCNEFVSSKGKWLSDPMRAKAITHCRSQGMVSSQRTSRIIEYFPKLYKLPLQCVIQIYNKRQTQNSFLSLLIIRKPYE